MATTDLGAGQLRLPADRRSVARPGPSWEGPAAAVKALLETASRGALDAIPSLLSDTAAETFGRLLSRQGGEAVGASLRRHGRTLLDTHLERALELPEGTVEFRLRLYRLEPGGQISSCVWVVQIRESGGRWRISSFDRFPGAPGDPA